MQSRLLHANTHMHADTKAVIKRGSTTLLLVATENTIYKLAFIGLHKAECVIQWEVGGWCVSEPTDPCVPGEKEMIPLLGTLTLTLTTNPGTIIHNSQLPKGYGGKFQHNNTQYNT